MKTRHFRDLHVWQRSMSLARQIYTLTAQLPKDETFGLCSQMRRCAVSIPSNIAEGQGRLTDKSFAVFLSQARGSLFELQTQVELAGALQYLPPDEVRSILDESAEIARMINGLLAALRTETAHRTHSQSAE